MQENCCKMMEVNPPVESFQVSEFDDWAGSYDASVPINQFPFWGYQNVLAKIVALAEPRLGMSVLDLGTGTGNLAARLAALGCDLWCTDFSSRMLERARQKIPAAHFFKHDLRSGWLNELDRPFDLIVSTYVFHHFELDEKIRIIMELLLHLKPTSRVIIGDIAFPNLAFQAQVKNEIGAEFDQEYYWLADESLVALHKVGIVAEYTQVSPCAGVFAFSPDEWNNSG